MINLLVSGDFVPAIDPFAIRENLFGEFEDIFAQADCHITNLECPLTMADKPIEKTGPTLKAHPGAIKLLQQAKVNVACLANNHVFDYGETGLQETIKVCEENGIETLGVVNRSDGKKAWLLKEIKGVKIGFLNYCEHEFSVREDGDLGANGYDPLRCYYDVSALRPQVDRLIVLYHGGNEYYPLPRPGLKKTFHYLADLGADAVIGHHTHVIGGYEMYKGKPLVYSLGNYFFPYENEPEEWYDGMLCMFSLDIKNEIQFIPFQQCKSGNHISLISENYRKNQLTKMALLSAIINDDDVLNKNWRGFVEDKAKGYLKLFPGVCLIAKVLLKLGVPLSNLLPDAKTISAFNVLRCQSHYDVIIDSLVNQIKK